jgi:hypothetical protein
MNLEIKKEEGRSWKVASGQWLVASLIFSSFFLHPSAFAQTNAQVTLWWNYPTNFVTADMGFVLYTTTDLANAFSNWTVLTNLSVTNTVATNLDATGTNFVFSLSQRIQVGQHFFVMTASNFWGLGNTSNAAFTPPVPATNNLLKITRP